MASKMQKAVERAEARRAVAARKVAKQKEREAARHKKRRSRATVRTVGDTTTLHIAGPHFPDSLGLVIAIYFVPLSIAALVILLAHNTALSWPLSLLVVTAGHAAIFAWSVMAPWIVKVDGAGFCSIKRAWLRLWPWSARTSEVELSPVYTGPYTQILDGIRIDVGRSTMGYIKGLSAADMNSIAEFADQHLSQ